MKKLTGLFLALLFLFASQLSAASSENILVAGFRNTGAESDDNINIVLTKSLINLLAALQNVKVVGYDALERTTLVKEYWHSETFDMGVIENAGLRFSVNKVVYGDYKVNHDNNTISITYSVYDVQSDAVLMTRSLEGAADIDIFDTIESLAKKAAVTIVGSELDYDALVSTYRGEGPNTHVIMRNYVVPSGIAATLGTGLIMYALFNNNLTEYWAAFTNYNNAADNNTRTIYYNQMSDLTNAMSIDNALQIGFYSAAAVLTGVEVYLLIRKPETSEAFRVIALPNYIGFQYGF